jgi:hypothetical protein
MPNFSDRTYAVAQAINRVRAATAQVLSLTRVTRSAFCLRQSGTLLLLCIVFALASAKTKNLNIGSSRAITAGYQPRSRGDRVSSVAEETDLDQASS